MLGHKSDGMNAVPSGWLTLVRTRRTVRTVFSQIFFFSSPLLSFFLTL